MADLPLRCEHSAPRGRAWRVVHALADGVLAQWATPCPLCQERAFGGVLCTLCHDQLIAPFLSGVARCPRCSLALSGLTTCHDCAFLAPAFERVIAAFDYADPGDLLIQSLKRQHRFVTVRSLVALLLEAVARSTVPLPENLLLVPVPSHRVALRQRGFNPAAEIARPLAARLGADYQVGVLRRLGGSGQQKRRSRVARAQHAATGYDCVRRVDGRHVALVDDVMTTGSTLHHAALALKAAGALSVTGLVAARTPWRQGSRVQSLDTS